MIDQALLRLRPNAHWTLDGDKYSGITWYDKIQTKPTEQELLDEVNRLQAEYEATEYQRLRALEYPDFKEYLDGIVKNDQNQINKYINDCLAVKEKYPKPSGVI